MKSCLNEKAQNESKRKLETQREKYYTTADYRDWPGFDCRGEMRTPRNIIGRKAGGIEYIIVIVSYYLLVLATEK